MVAPQAAEQRGDVGVVERPAAGAARALAQMAPPGGELLTALCPRQVTPGAGQQLREQMDQRLTDTPIATCVDTKVRTPQHTRLLPASITAIAAPEALLELASLPEVVSLPPQDRSTNEWLRRLGLISYALYLWHWPLHVYLAPERLGLDAAWAGVVQAVAALVFATATYRFVEQPVRRGGVRALWPRSTAPRRLAPIAAAVYLGERGWTALPQQALRRAASALFLLAGAWTGLAALRLV